MRTKSSRLSFNRLSIQQRLPLLICAFLLFAIVIYGFANYFSLRKATLTIGKDRVNSLTNQISSMLGQSAQFLVKAERSTAGRKSVIACLKSVGRNFRVETNTELNKLHRDSTYVSTELLDNNQTILLRSDKSTVHVSVNLTKALLSASLTPDSAKVGNFFYVKGATYYPIIAAVTEKKHILGYIVCWKWLPASKKAVEQLTQLMGAGTNLYLGNTDGSFWTNTLQPISALSVNSKQLKEPIEYPDKFGRHLIAKAQPVAYTDWLAVIELSEQNVMEGVNTFMKWIFLFGVLLMTVGAFAAWVMSRNITRPLNELTDAAKLISKGDYSSPMAINVYRNDELAELAIAFNVMTSEIYHMWQDMDTKVKERTLQLEIVNKELEAFSYSVSHDLRTPLRAINGYSIMLKEDYDSKLDAEGNRIIRNIITNAKMMGQLIDDLLAFSRMGKKELVSTQVDMQLLVKNVADELLQNHPGKDDIIHIGVLSPATADLGMIKQVLINLVGNAIKYSSKKAEPKIEIGSRDEQNKTIYFVKDNGVGFDMAYVGKLFGVFQRLHSQEEFEGTGVGLALVKRIIDKHKGEIWAEGQENIGATFYFSLPTD
ncbi:MAG: ATP-binding protein [Bacteroidia bacterium]